MPNFQGAGVGARSLDHAAFERNCSGAEDV